MQHAALAICVHTASACSLQLTQQPASSVHVAAALVWLRSRLAQQLHRCLAQ
jgi:hypothetical protein